MQGPGDRGPHPFFLPLNHSAPKRYPLTQEAGESWEVETVAWTETQDRPGQGGGKGEVSEEPEAWQEEVATEPAELAGCGWTWGQGQAAKGKSSSQWAEAAARGLRGYLFSASGDVSVSPQGRASDHSFYFLCSLSKAN